MTKHTPGPWRVHEGDKPYHFNVSRALDGGPAVNVVRNVRDPNNAKLMAAAPTFAALLDRFVEYFDAQVGCTERKPVMLIDDARKALQDAGVMPKAVAP